ncbi:hypothetical protein DFH07DRAFT_779344 [Mycena maculata]|uniref:Zn(2)-C6 fungal-type domain-containing protein n=1 Tax=Mycena maculata TaxID=230809 RepID=A0AAD7I8H0_9AGAR|nr:hypothetical protein DFH07DRAFT_779344 [Mycena maculata]
MLPNPNRSDDPPSLLPVTTPPPAHQRNCMACIACRIRKITCVTNKKQPQYPCERCTKEGVTCEYVPVPTEEPFVQGNYKSPDPTFLQPLNPESFTQDSAAAGIFPTLCRRLPLSLAISFRVQETLPTLGLSPHVFIMVPFLDQPGPYILGPNLAVNPGTGGALARHYHSAVFNISFYLPALAALSGTSQMIVTLLSEALVPAVREDLHSRHVMLPEQSRPPEDQWDARLHGILEV